MIGEGYWSTGISLRYVEGNGWTAHLNFKDAGFCEDGTTEGELYTRYYLDSEDAVSRQIDTLKADAEKLGIEWRSGEGTGWLFFHGDGEDPQFPPPEGWRDLLAREAERIGFVTYQSVGI